MSKYIDAEKLIAEIERFKATEYGDNTFGDDVANGALDYVLEEIIPPLQQEMWKPNEEQMKALYCALNDAISLYSDKVSPLYEEISRTHFDALESLYNDLKKLI